MENNNNESFINAQSLKVVFMGTPDFAVPSLMALIKHNYQIAGVVTQPDKPQGRHMVITPPPVKVIAIENKIPVFQPEKIREESFNNIIREISPDLIITAAYGKILPKSILEIPKFGCINVHASLLPKYRGAAPVQWCIINGDSKSGITIMEMDVGMDTGNIIRQVDVDIPFDINAGQLMDRLAVAGASILSDTILSYCNGEVKSVAQDSSQATDVKQIRKEEGLISWSENMENIHNLIRGCNPWPVAYTFFKGKRMKIFEARPWKDFSDICFENNLDLPPGSILVSESKTNLYIACDDGFVEIIDLALEGSRRMLASECAHNFLEGVLG